MTHGENRGKLITIFGGQYGSEGKGQIAAHLSIRNSYQYAVRVGGPNAGHTFILPNGQKQVLQSVPIGAFMDPECVGVIGCGGIILPELLEKEVLAAQTYLGEPMTLIIDGTVAVIKRNHMAAEHAGLTERIGSTGEGVGAAAVDRLMRLPEAVIDSEINQDIRGRWHNLPGFTNVDIQRKTAHMLNLRLWEGQDVIVEGTQGVLLSLNSSGYYPYCTSRECTPQAILAEAGINDRNASRSISIMVARSYPIRVGGNSGPLPGELKWEELTQFTKGYVQAPEITTVTKKPRRIGMWNWDIMREVVRISRPTCMALTFFDYWYPEITGKTQKSALTTEMVGTIKYIRKNLGVEVALLSTGFGSVIELEELR